MPGELRGDRVLVPQEREANQLYNKGAFGVPQSGGALLLDLVEAAHLAETNRLEVREAGKPLAVGDLIRLAAQREPEFEIRLLVYRDLRARGYLVKPEAALLRAGDERRPHGPPDPVDNDAPDFHVYPRGGLPGKSPSSHVVLARSERSLFDARNLVAAAERAQALKKKLLVAIVDEEGDLTYYATTLGDPKGRVPAELKDLHATRAYLLADRVIVFGAEFIEELRSTEYYGHPVGFGLQLGFAETLYLMENAGLRVRTASDEELTLDQFRERARALQDDFDLRYRVFCDLRARGLVGKTGFKFGTHFRGYAERPDEEHSPFLIHAVTEAYQAAWPEVSGFVRLAHGVRKRLLFALPRPDGGAVAYLQLERTRP